MGYEMKEIKVVCSVSRHGTESDREDDADWEELTNRIKMIANEHRYSHLTVSIF